MFLNLVPESAALSTGLPYEATVVGFGSRGDLRCYVPDPDARHAHRVAVDALVLEVETGINAAESRAREAFDDLISRPFPVGDSSC